MSTRGLAVASSGGLGNTLRSALVILVGFVVVGAIGYGLGLLVGAAATGLFAGLALAALMSFASYAYGERMVLAAAGARAASEEQEPRLHNLLDGLCLTTGVPKPRLYVVADGAMNAFSTGRGPARSSLAVTRGLLEGVNRVELEAVLAHELSHVHDGDVLPATMAATLVGAPVLANESILRDGTGSAGSAAGRATGASGLHRAVLFALGLLLAIPGLLFAPLIRLAVSSEREYAADTRGATWTRYPPALANALRKAATSPTRHRANWATAHLWLLQPSAAGPLASLLDRLPSTHPPVEDRIRILEEM